MMYLSSKYKLEGRLAHSFAIHLHMNKFISIKILIALWFIVEVIYKEPKSRGLRDDSVVKNTCYPSEDQSLVPSTHVGQHTITCNSSSRESNPQCGLIGWYTFGVHSFKCMHIYMQIKIIKRNKKEHKFIKIRTCQLNCSLFLKQVSLHQLKGCLFAN